MDSLFSAQLSSDDGDCVVRVSGEVDLAVSEKLAEVGRLAAASPSDRGVVIDLAGLGFIDMAGLGALVDARAAALDAGKRFTMRNVPSRMNRMVRLAELDPLLAAA